MKLSAPPPPPPPPPEQPAPGDQPPPDPNAGANTPGTSTTDANAPGAAAPEVGAPEPVPAPKPLSWPSWYPGVDSALAALVLVFAFAAASFVARNSDLWLHLAAGKRLFQGQYVPGSDPFSYSAADRAWVNHSWLTDAFAYLLYGGEGKVLVIAKALLVALTFGVLMAIRRPQFPLWPWAAAACVAVLAAAPQFTLRPTVVSMLFLAATLFILFRLPHKPDSWRFPIAIGVTFWLWANCDAWFFLGPLALALLIVGDLVQTKFLNSPEEPPTGEEPLGRLPDAATLAKALGIGVLACMLNPHHVRVWQPPFELIGMAGAEADPRLRQLLFTTYDNVYSSSPSLGYNLNGLAFAVLIVGGAALMGFGYGRLRGSHVALWIGFLLLSLLSVYAVPFFAIIAVPLVASQLNDLGARAELKTWGDPKSRLLLIGSSLGRVVCVLGVCALCVLAYPGWVHPETSNPAYARRVAWGVEPDAHLVRAAEQLNQWREQGKLPDDARGVIAHPDLANYVAWYAPREKVFVNARFNHHRRELADYLRLRKGLGLIVVKDERANYRDAVEVLSKVGADYLVVSGSANDSVLLLARATEAGVRLQVDWKEWSPWYVDGRTTVLGWQPAGAAGRPAFAALRVDPVALAFSPNAARLPEPEMRPPLPQVGWEGAFIRSPRPTPTGFAEAFGWLNYKDALRPRLAEWDNARNRARLRRAIGLDLLGSASPEAAAHREVMLAAKLYGAVPAPPEPPPPPSPEPAGDLAAAVAAPLLALRAARRAVAEDPDNPEPYFAVAVVLLDQNLPLSESERALGRVAALRRCLDRLPRPEYYRRGQFAVSAREVAFQLALAYLGREIVRTDQRTGQQSVAGFYGVPIDVEPLNQLLGHAVYGDQRNNVQRRRPGVQIPKEWQLLSGNTLYLIAPDAALEALKLAQEYASLEAAGDDPDVIKARSDDIKEVMKLTETELIRATQLYDELRAGKSKVSDLLGAALMASLPDKARELLAHPDTDLKKEFGDNLLGAAVLTVALELALGRIEEADGSLNAIAAPGGAQSGRVLQLLRYQKSLHAGEYKTAGELWESMHGGGVGTLDKLGPLGPNLDRAEVLQAIAAGFQTREPEKALAGLTRPPALLPLPAPLKLSLLRAEASVRSPQVVANPQYQPIVPELWVSNWANLTGGLQQAVAAQLQSETNFFYRRGVLSLLEGDIPAAKRRFEQATRKPPAGWNLPNFGHENANFYLGLINLAEKKAAAP